MLEKSKKVKPGTLVSIRGGKIVVCNNIKRAKGVYAAGETRRTISMDGIVRITSHPEGIVVHGLVSVRVADGQ